MLADMAKDIEAARLLVYRSAWEIDQGRRNTKYIEVLDGLQNVLPYGVGSEFMMRFSNLANAYKKNELLQGSGLGLFYMSSIPTDRAVPWRRTTPGQEKRRGAYMYAPLFFEAFRL